MSIAGYQLALLTYVYTLSANVVIFKV